MGDEAMPLTFADAKDRMLIAVVGVWCAFLTVKTLNTPTNEEVAKIVANQPVVTMTKEEIEELIEHHPARYENQYRIEQLSDRQQQIAQRQVEFQASITSIIQETRSLGSKVERLIVIMEQVEDHKKKE